MATALEHEPVASHTNAEPDVAVPDGWKLLPAGVRRRLRVLAKNIDQSKYPVFCVFTPDDWWVADAFELKVLGEVRMVHEPEGWWCGKQGTAYVETEAALLVRVA